MIPRQSLRGFIIAIVFLFTAATTTFAISVTPQMPSPTKATVEYSFPYPGLLPNHPLYVLKVARDRVVDFFTTEPQKHIEFLLLMADKRLIMGQTLIEEENFALAHSTILKGEQYFLRASEETKLLRKSNKATADELREKLRTAQKKHREVMAGIGSKLSSKQKKEWEDVFTTMDISGKNLR